VWKSAARRIKAKLNSRLSPKMGERQRERKSRKKVFLRAPKFGIPFLGNFSPRNLSFIYGILIKFVMIDLKLLGDVTKVSLGKMLGNLC